MRSTKYLVLSVSVFALASCASVPVTDKNLPAPEIAAEWSESQYDNARQSSDVRNGWLDDLEMDDLSRFVEEVLINNPDFKATAHRMEASGFGVKIARSNLFPAIDANLATRRQRSNSLLVSNNNVSLGFDARWEADVWGRLSARTAGAKANYTAFRADYAAARLSLVAQVSQAWFDVMEAQAQVDLALKTVESFERAVHIVEKRFSRGLNTGLDLRLVVSNYEAARASLSRREDQLGQQKRSLEILAGRYPSAKIISAGILPDINHDVPVGLPVNILERRPDLQSARAKLLSAGYSRQAADKDLLPSFSITASGSNSSANFTDLLRFDNIFWNLVGNITQPVFQGGRLRYAAKSEAALFEAEKQVFARTLLVAFKEVEDALSSERSLKKQVKHTATAAENAIAAENVALDQYSRGLIKISVLLESQRQSLSQQSQLLSIKKQRINNRIALHLALGGDFTIKEGIQANITNDNDPKGDITGENRL
ncbi:MAG: efflux transporter outer membrane subunit [Emcibacter sp.]|nr:efflux transporter outer membrane subunit [Emcibacter sp.]